MKREHHVQFNITVLLCIIFYLNFTLTFLECDIDLQNCTLNIYFNKADFNTKRYRDNPQIQ